jgi:putative oxidoreductase
MLQVLYRATGTVVGWLDRHGQPLLLLALRLYMAQAFFLAGLTKIRDWDTTLLLFMDEYHVPVLPPAVAAVAGTFGELVFPVLLVLGLFGRFAAAALFFVNIVAVISYPGLAEPALKEHFYWGTLLLVLLAFGPGRWAVDHWLRSWWTISGAFMRRPRLQR